MRKKTIFYDVDTQKDFMKKNGALYVPNAEKIIPNINALTKYALTNGTQLVGSVDRHFKGDAELNRNGGPFPNHCMDNTEGQKKINQKLIDKLSQNPTIFVENKKIGEKGLEKIVNERKIFLEKQHYDVFTNQNTEHILKEVNTAFVYGVATDYCVKAATLGMRNLGIEVYLVTDAIKGVAEETTQTALKEMKEAGVKTVTTSQILNKSSQEELKK